MLRSLLAALLVLALIPTVTLANTTVWAGRTILDPAAFGSAVDHALDDPSFAASMARRVTRELVGVLVERDERVRPLLAQVLGLGPAASDGQIIRALEPRVATALDDPRARTARGELVADAHDAVRGVERPEAHVRLVGDQFVVDLRPLLQNVLASLDVTVPGGELTIPAGAATEIRLEPAPGLAAARDGLSALERLILLLPVTALLLGLLVVVLAHRRARAVGIVGATLVLAGLVGIGVVLAGTVVIGRTGAALDPALVNGTVGAFGGVLLVQSAALAGVGLVLAFVGAFASGRASRPQPRLAEDW